MSETTTQIIEQLKTMTLLEASELVSQIEETFGVDASAPVGGGMMMAAPTGDAGAAESDVVEEKTTFDIIINDIPSDKRVAVLKIIRKLTTMTLGDAKNFTTSLPGTLKEGISKEEADDAKKDLEAAGATVQIN